MKAKSAEATIRHPSHSSSAGATAKLPKTMRAVAIDRENEVAWYRLAQIQKALGKSDEQQKSLTEYRRLHDIASQQKGLEPVFSPREVTKQEVDPNSSP